MPPQNIQGKYKLLHSRVYQFLHEALNHRLEIIFAGFRKQQGSNIRTGFVNFQQGGPDIIEEICGYILINFVIFEHLPNVLLPLRPFLFLVAKQFQLKIREITGDIVP